MLAVGSTGHGAFVGMLVGSVMEHCVGHARCPVVVVRHCENAAEGTLISRGSFSVGTGQATKKEIGKGKIQR